MARLSSDTRNFLKGMAFISPWLVGFAAFLLMPICLSFYYSLCDFPVFKPPVYIGGRIIEGCSAIRCSGR